MRLYKVKRGTAVEKDSRFYLLRVVDWDELLARDDLEQWLVSEIGAKSTKLIPSVEPEDILAPISMQEVWAAGVTYFRSRSARMEEAGPSGGGDFYDRVYSAERPELFFKATAHRIAGQGEPVRIRADSLWNVPEPELTLVIAASGKIIGYTIGNDMSSRDIEGKNPLYLPQAKIYDRSCALGPGILVTTQALDATTTIEMTVARGGETVFEGGTSLAAMKRSPESLVEYLYRECSFPHGCFLLTGTGIIPPDNFTLQKGDEVRITIEPIGTLINFVQ